MDIEPILNLLKARVPDLRAVYVFGSRAGGLGGPDSDLDLAVLGQGRLDPLCLWQVAGALEDVAGCPVDLVDLQEASTVMRYQVVTTGQRWWAHGLDADLFEVRVLSDKTALEEWRGELVRDILREGRVHGR